AHALTLHALRITGKFAPLRWLVAQQFKALDKPVEASYAPAAGDGARSNLKKVNKNCFVWY
ncbi:MAG: hypothetical protein Q8K73_04835, partial [Anaerolineales bacterium]|nr:hypothetical protein [Anaerolineales bacterium]